MHKLAVLALHGVVPLDLGIACDAFGRVRLSNGRMAYRVLVCGEARRVRSGAFDIHSPCGLERIAGADTLIIPGIDDADRTIPTSVLTTIRRAWDRGARIVTAARRSLSIASRRALAPTWRPYSNGCPSISTGPLILTCSRLKSA
jgi:hypothetical protein